MNILAALQIAAAASTKADPRQTIADVVLLYGLYEQNKAGKLDLAAMAHAGTLKGAVDALARLTAVLSQVMSDPSQAANVAALVTG